jgi:hypothetical protein
MIRATNRRAICVRRRNRRGQAMVEFGIVLPVFLLMVVGSILVYSWQLDIDSAHFSALEGVQTTTLPSSTGALTGDNGLLCLAGRRAYQAAINQSFLRATPLVGNSGANCTSNVGVSPDFAASCPAGNVKPTNANMTGAGSRLQTLAGTSTNAIVICVWCQDLTPPNAGRICSAGGFTPAPTDQIQVDVSVAGYKPIPVNIPVLGRRMVYYGQDEQNIQEFQQ